MLSTRMYQEFYFIMRIYSFLGTLPFIWNESTRNLEISTRLRRILRRHFVVISFQILFLFGQCIRFKVEKNYNLFNQTYGATCFALILVQMYIFLIFMETETCAFDLSFIPFLRYMNRKLIKYLHIYILTVITINKNKTFN